MTPDEWRASIAGYASPLTDILSDGDWKGGPCFIVGGGPSLKGFDFKRLPEARTLVINRTFEFMPQAAILFSMDSLYYREACRKPKTDPRRFPGVKVWLDTHGFPYQGVLLVKSRGECGLSESLGLGLYHGANSGYGAVGLAACLGADPIYLLGFDMDPTKSLTHFHSGYIMRTGREKVARYIKNFEALAPLLEARGFHVMNLSLTSGLRCFPKASIDEVLY
jgi:hypothetical protein